MASDNPTKTLTVALIGNPNTGKSTLFSALCGVRQRTGNYPGVTVEKKLGHAEFHWQPFTIVDLPGSYSLAPRSPDEMIAVDVLLGREETVDDPDAILCIIDASNLERNLYLVSQVLELGKPTVIALNMCDVAIDRGIKLDVELLQKRLPVPIIEIQANRKRGLAELKQALIDAIQDNQPPPASPFPEEFQAEVTKLGEQCEQSRGEPFPRYLVERLLLDTSGYLSESLIRGKEINESIDTLIKESRERLAKVGLPVPAVEAMSRYKWVGEILEGAVERPTTKEITISDRIDRVLTHRLWGTAIFALLMVILFQAVFWIAGPASELIDAGKSYASGLISANLAEGALRSLIINGVIEGVGGVLVFLPQIFVLFLFIAILEDCGYMSRAAYLMDRLMSRIGLSGKSFIPLLSSFACAVPGIMAARVIENPKDRLITILVAPLMSCSARLPVYTLLIGAFIPEQRVFGVFGLQGLTMFAMYAIGIVAAVVVALVLRGTILKGTTPPFIMELPSYKFPGLGIVLHRMLERGWAFVQRAGTLIFAVTILVWAAAYYPRYEAAANPSEQLRHSFLGQAGQFVEPVVEPLGWDWKLGCAAIASFPAREVVIATLGVIYNLGEDEDEESETLRETLRTTTWEGTDRRVFNIPVALSVMVFFALCAQCSSTLAVIKRETNSWRWPAFTFVYMTALAYFAALVTYQVGIRVIG